MPWAASVTASLKDLIEAGNIIPVVERIYELSEAAQAMAHSGRATHRAAAALAARSQSVSRQSVPQRHTEPVSSWGESTGFDSGEPFCRRKTDRSTSAPTDRNSLCQFWSDSNQKRFVAM